MNEETLKQESQNTAPGVEATRIFTQTNESQEFGDKSNSEGENTQVNKPFRYLTAVPTDKNEDELFVENDVAFMKSDGGVILLNALHDEIMGLNNLLTQVPQAHEGGNMAGGTPENNSSNATRLDNENDNDNDNDNDPERVGQKRKKPPSSNNSESSKRQKLDEALNDKSAIDAAEALLNLGNVNAAENIPAITVEQQRAFDENSRVAITAINNEVTRTAQQGGFNREDVSFTVPSLRIRAAVVFPPRNPPQPREERIELTGLHLPNNLREILTSIDEQNGHQAAEEAAEVVDNRPSSLRRKALMLNMLKNLMMLLVDAIALLRLETANAANIALVVGGATISVSAQVVKYLKTLIIKIAKCISLIMFYFVSTFPLTSTVLVSALALYYSKNLRDLIVDSSYTLSVYVLQKLDRLLYQFVGATAGEIGPAIAQTVGSWVKNYIVSPITSAFMARFAQQAAQQSATNAAQTHAIQQLTQQVAALTEEQAAQTSQIVTAIQAQNNGGVMQAITNGVGQTAGGMLGNMLVAAGAAGRVAAGPPQIAMGGKQYKKGKKSKKSKTKKSKKTRKTHSRKKRNSRNKKRITLKSKKSFGKIKMRRR